MTTNKESVMAKNDTTAAVSYADGAATSDKVKLVGADGTTVELRADDKAEINRLRYGLGYTFATAAAAKRAAQ